MKKLLVLLFLLGGTVLCFSQSIGDISAFAEDTISVDTTLAPLPIPPIPGDGLFGLGWGWWLVILGGAEAVLRILPIPSKWTIIGIVQMLYKAIPNNAPDKRKLPMWLLLMLSASIMGCGLTGGVHKVTRERDKTCVEGQASFDSAFPQVNEDSLLQAWSNQIARYLYVRHLTDTGTVRYYGWGICIPDTLFESKSLGDAFE